MKKSLIVMLTLMFTGMFMISCNKDTADSEATIENFVNESVQDLETRTRVGRGGCFELVFPVTIAFANGDEVEVGSYEELKAAIRQWRRDNHVKPGRPVIRPHFVFPIDVITNDGETVTVENQLELLELRKDCLQIGNGQGRPCFRLNFPLSLVYPNGTTTAYNTPQEMRRALREWRRNNPTAIYRPVLSFPISVTMEDGSVVTVNSREELISLKRDCN
ncbi:MAG: hypothetical protein IPN29_19675 [Saprospiraceae bacterium]|nr:hypothetical protein [Saprospiraceae bacterium]